VRAVDEDAEYEMLVVDRQRGHETVSRFWMGDFLGAEVALDAIEHTKRLYRGLRAARNEVEQDLDASSLAALDQVIAGAIVQASVNVDTLIAGLPVPQTLRTRIDATLSADLPDREFDLDPSTSSQFLRRRTFRADHDIRVSVLDEFKGFIRLEDLGEGLRRVSFETRTWKET
jgi:hypothetical protein